MAATEASARAPLASKSYYRLDAAPIDGCAVGAACEAKLVVTALDGYHVNERYPTKWIAETTPGVTVHDTQFTPDGKTGTMVVAFKADKPGPAKLSGVFKLSVCSDENCQLEEPKIALDVAVR